MSPLKALLHYSDVIFWDYQTVALILYFTYDLVIISTLAIIIYQESHWVNILCQYSSLQYCPNILILIWDI